MTDAALLAQLRVQARAYIAAWLAEDYWTITQIEAALAQAGATPRQVAESFSIAAASLLSDAFLADTHAAEDLAVTETLRHAARQTRTLLAAAQPGSGS